MIPYQKTRRPRQTALALRVDEGPRLPEKVLQSQTIRLLAHLGYRTLTIGGSRPRVRCPHCGEWSAAKGHVGNDPGAPDLLVSRDGWPRGQWLGMELKARGRLKADCTRVRPEQAALAAAGRTVIVHSLAEAVDAVLAAEIGLGNINPKASRFWEKNPRKLFE